MGLHDHHSKASDEMTDNFLNLSLIMFGCAAGVSSELRVSESFYGFLDNMTSIHSTGGTPDTLQHRPGYLLEFAHQVNTSSRLEPRTIFL
jgi:hypothetical protein